MKTYLILYQYTFLTDNPRIPFPSHEGVLVRLHVRCAGGLDHLSALRRYVSAQDRVLRLPRDEGPSRGRRVPVHVTVHEIP